MHVCHECKGLGFMDTDEKKVKFVDGRGQGEPEKFNRELVPQLNPSRNNKGGALPIVPDQTVYSA